MRLKSITGLGWIVLLLAGATVTAQEHSSSRNCKAFHASMIEQRMTVGCKPEHAFCFLGEVTGNHGLRGTTYFKGDASSARMAVSPNFLPYSGVFEYHLEGGTLTMRETGVTNTSQGLVESGAVTAFQVITGATGEWAGATGFFFVSGFSRNGRIETTVTGEVCLP